MGSDGAVYMVGAVTVRPAQGCVTSQREISLVPAGMHHVLRKKISNLGGSGHLSLTRTNFSLFSTMYELQPQPVSGCDFDVCDASELRHQYGSSVNPSCRFLLRQDTPLKASWESYRHSASVGVIEVMEHYLHRNSWSAARRAGMLSFNSSVRLHSSHIPLDTEFNLQVSIERPKLIVDIERGEGDNVYGLVDFGLVDLNENASALFASQPTHFRSYQAGGAEFVDDARGS